MDCGLLCQHFAHFKDSLSCHCCVFISRTLRILFHSIVTLVFILSTSGYSFIRKLRYYIAHYIFRILFFRLLCLYLVHSQDSISMDGNVSIPRSFRVRFYWIFTSYVTFVSSAFFVLSYGLFILQYLVHILDSLSFDQFPGHSTLSIRDTRNGAQWRAQRQV